MYLKSLKLVGFKSFADRTHFELRPGVTVVVGPNGSGKSNIVDALAWVMGTQSAKALRTGKMEDVIFSGTTTRPSLNRAEVTLVIDNDLRRLPLDLDEVAITRRLYRDGSSDYEINGVGCRLLDIQDLLSDSGVGRHQHVIIGQGEIGQILGASPEEHRAVVEEAAGILKHRRRKEKAERRLDRTDDDLVRLEDLVGELERQMRPLKRQARAAERYDGLKAEVGQLRLYLANRTLVAFDSESEALSGEQEELRRQLESDEASLVVIGEELEATTDETRRTAAGLESDTAAAAVLETTVERLRRLGSVAHERARASAGRLEAAEKRRQDLEAEIQAIGSELRESEATVSAAAVLARAKEESFRRLEDEERSIATQTALSPEGAIAALRGELSVLDAAMIRDQRENDAIQARISVLQSQLESETSEIDVINDEVRRLDGRLSELSVIYESSSRKRKTSQEAWTEAETSFSARSLEEAAARARVESVSATLQGAVDLETRRRVEQADGSLGPVVGLLDVPEEWGQAVEAVLGHWFGSVVFGSSEHLKRATELVRGDGVGGVSLIRGVSDARPLVARDIATSSGLSLLVDHLGPDADRPLAESLMGDVVVAEGWASGWSLVERHPEIRVVTPEGDLISAAGVKLAHPDGTGPAILESVEVGLERAETELARCESILTSARRDFEKSREAERAALESVEAVEAELAGKTEAMARLQKSVDALLEEETRLRTRAGSLSDGIADQEAQASRLRDRLSALEGEEAERMRAWNEMESRRLDLAAQRELARSEWQSAATEHKAITERRRLLDERKEQIGAELAKLDGVGGGASAEVSRDTLRIVERHAKEAVALLARKVAILRERQSELREANQRLVEDLEAKRSLYEKTRSRIDGARERASQIEIRLTELRLQRQNIIEAVRRDADVEIRGPIEVERPDQPEDADLEQILEGKIAQLRRLGPINPLAASEYSQLSERHEFITSQLEDVRASRTELRRVIAALEDEIQSRFEEAFAEIAEAYQRYFTILFPGGRGRIRLDDPDDNQSGLVIDAQPLGKKVSQMSLLSGGERSLAALAFLFSIFEARPSPFYVLDEVEAALDDANLRRFLRIVDEFRQRAQLVIVTHQQQTMEAADVLYGVTMEPGGSSSAVRKDMTHAQADQVA